MRLKSALVTLSLSLVCLIPRVSFADSLTLTGVGGQSTNGFYVYPYQFTVVASGTTSTNVFMSCLNFDREITFNETWTVNSMGVSKIGVNGLDNESQKSYLEDAYLYNQYAGAAGNAAQISDIQFAIWSIMDPNDIKVVNGQPTYSGFNANAQALAAAAKSNFANVNDPLANYTNDFVFVPDPGGSATWTANEPQIFMGNNIPGVPQGGPLPPTPEPASLILLGTGMIGMVAIMRRKLVKAEPLIPK